MYTGLHIEEETYGIFWLYCNWGILVLKIHGSLDVAINPIRNNPSDKFSKYVLPASLSPYRLFRSFKTSWPFLSFKTTLAGGLRNIEYFTSACGYACTKSTDFVWRLCDFANVSSIRTDDHETTGAYVSQ